MTENPGSSNQNFHPKRPYKEELELKRNKLVTRQKRILSPSAYRQMKSIEKMREGGQVRMQ
jgi:hypothetical protein